MLEDVTLTNDNISRLVAESCRRIYEMMTIRSTELVLIEIMSVTFCYPCNLTRDALHSKIL
jgi:hypothetical protein